MTISFIESVHTNPSSILVDIRTPDEFASGHIAGAINVDFYSPDFVTRMTEIGRAKELYIYCRSGARSGSAVAALSQAGLHVVDLPGGIMANGDLLENK